MSTTASTPHSAHHRFASRGGPPAATPATAPWRTLRLFLGYRLLLGGSLALLFFTGAGPAFLGRTDPAIFSGALFGYLGMGLFSLLLITLRREETEQQAYVMVFVDVLTIPLMMYASGGVGSGLGMLLIPSITGGALLMEGRAAMLFASLAALAILAEQVYSQINMAPSTAAYTQAGLLGASFLAMAVLAHVLSGRAQASAELASRHADDLASLAQLNEQVIQQMQTGVVALDNKGRIRLMNETAWQLLGMPAAGAGDPVKQASPELARMLQRWIRDPDYRGEPFVAAHRGDELRPSFNRLGAREFAGALIFLEDGSRVTRQAMQMKLASLGRLTASIAHEIRNPLGAISHAGQLLGESPELGHGDRRLTEIIRSNSARVNQIIESVLQLSRPGVSEQRRFALQPWLDELAAELRGTLGLGEDGIVVQIEPADTEVVADPVQLRQIVTNLCENAVRHAAKPAAAVRITIGGNGEGTRDGLILDLCDNGPGIPKMVARQIFDPFFTTGASGTGLGLYIARELAEANGLRLEHFSPPTGGSCFRLQFEA